MSLEQGPATEHALNSLSFAHTVLKTGPAEYVAYTRGQQIIGENIRADCDIVSTLTEIDILDRITTQGGISAYVQMWMDRRPTEYPPADEFTSNILTEQHLVQSMLTMMDRTISTGIEAEIRKKNHSTAPIHPSVFSQESIDQQIKNNPSIAEASRLIKRWTAEGGTARQGTDVYAKDARTTWLIEELHTHPFTETSAIWGDVQPNTEETTKRARPIDGQIDAFLGLSDVSPEGAYTTFIDQLRQGNTLQPRIIQFLDRYIQSPIDQRRFTYGFLFAMESYARSADTQVDTHNIHAGISVLEHTLEYIAVQHIPESVKTKMGHNKTLRQFYEMSYPSMMRTMIESRGNKQKNALRAFSAYVTDAYGIQERLESLLTYAPTAYTVYKDMFISQSQDEAPKMTLHVISEVDTILQKQLLRVQLPRHDAHLRDACMTDFSQTARYPSIGLFKPIQRVMAEQGRIGRVFNSLNTLPVSESPSGGLYQEEVIHYYLLQLNERAKAMAANDIDAHNRLELQMRLVYMWIGAQRAPIDLPMEYSRGRFISSVLLSCPHLVAALDLHERFHPEGTTLSSTKVYNKTEQIQALLK
jgi:hypothetical protein